MRGNERLMVLLVIAPLGEHFAWCQDQFAASKDGTTCSIRGQVVNKLTGTAIKHATIRLRPVAQDAQIFSTATLASLGLGSQPASSYSTVSCNAPRFSPS
jgi:hypothetical protein